ncbi:MAG: creatininase family protein [bacterium]
MNDNPRSRLLEELNWQEFRELVPARLDAVILPVGTVEAHGVTGLGTDNQIPLAIARRIAPGVNALVAPAVAYGITRSLLAYPGSLTVTPATFEHYAFEVARGLAGAGFRRIIVLNGHGGNTDALKSVAGRLGRECGARVMAIDWWTLCADDTRAVYGHDGGHGGTDETALVLADRPGDVRRELDRPDLAFVTRPGLVTVPSPGSVILYGRDEGRPDFDTGKAARLMELVCCRIEETVLAVFRGWDVITPQAD